MALSRGFLLIVVFVARVLTDDGHPSHEHANQHIEHSRLRDSKHVHDQE